MEQLVFIAPNTGLCQIIRSYYWDKYPTRLQKNKSVGIFLTASNRDIFGQLQGIVHNNEKITFVLFRSGRALPSRGLQANWDLVSNHVCNVVNVFKERDLELVYIDLP